MAASFNKQLGKKKGKEKTTQWDFPTTFNFGQQKTKPKPEGRISYNALRKFSVYYPVARACIDYLKTKVVKLNWSIVPVDKEKEVDKYDPRVMLVNDFINSPLGEKSKYRNFIDAIVEDYLVIGSLALEKIKTRGGQFLSELKLVDAGTISLRVDEYGRTPTPPDIAFVQFIKGMKTAELTADELIYIKRNARTNTLFGLSPIESIIIQSESFIRGSLYNLSWYTDGNIPEGFGELPEGWDLKQIKEFQKYFDAIMAGNPTFQRRIKMVPAGFKYDQIKKPSEIGFERFELWLVELTTSVFGVPPSDIGFTLKVNKSSSESQQEMGQERGMRPLAQMLEEMMTDVIQNDFGFKDLKFSYVDVDPVDRKLEAEVDNIRLEGGVISVDEIRAREGMEAIGLNHYVKGAKGLVTVDQINNPPKPVEMKPKEKPEEDNVDEEQKADLIVWQRQSKNAFKRKTPFKKFSSEVLDNWMIEEIYSQLVKVSSKDQIKFVFEPYLNNKMQIVKGLQNLTNEITKLSKSDKKSSA